MSTQLNYLFLLIGLWLSGIPAVAQSSPAIAQLDTQLVAQAAPDTAAAILPAAAPDTAAAIHRLFVSKRRVLRYVISGTFLAAVAATIVVTDASETGFINTRGPVAFGMGLISGGVILGETLSYTGWSRKKERRALEDWQRHQLPALYHRKLKPKYFR